MNTASGGGSGVVSITVEPPWWSGTKAFFGSIGTSLYDMGNRLSFGWLEAVGDPNWESPRYEAQIQAEGDRLYNISKNLGYSDESIASGYGLIQAVGGEVTGMNMIAEAYEGYDLGENRALETDERVIKAAAGTAQAAGTVAGGLKITGVNPKITHSRNLPKNLEYSAKVQEHLRNPKRFVPQSIIREVIKKGKALPDPRGSNATMYYTRIWKNGQLYNIEVLYAPSVNTVWHVMYTRSPIGPLPAIL